MLIGPRSPMGVPLAWSMVVLVMSRLLLNGVELRWSVGPGQTPAGLPSPKRPSGQIVVPPFGGIRGTGISHTLAPVRRELGWRDRAVDGALALGAAVANVLAVTFPDKTVAYDFAGGGPLHVGVVAFTGLILWWRRSAPGRVFVLCTLAVTGVTLAHWDPGLLPLNYAVATFSLGAHATIRDGLRGRSARHRDHGLDGGCRCPLLRLVVGRRGAGTADRGVGVGRDDASRSQTGRGSRGAPTRARA
jgi:hypothetical protein